MSNLIQSGDCILQGLDDGIRFFCEDVEKPLKRVVPGRGWLVDGYVKGKLCIVLGVSQDSGGTSRKYNLIFHRVKLRRENEFQAFCRGVQPSITPRPSTLLDPVMELGSDHQANAVLPVGYMGHLSRNLVVKGKVFASAVWFQPQENIMQVVRNSAAFFSYSRPEARLRVRPWKIDRVVGPQIALQRLASSKCGLVESVLDVFDSPVGKDFNFLRNRQRLQYDLLNFERGIIIRLDNNLMWPIVEMLPGLRMKLIESFAAPREALLGSLKKFRNGGHK